MPLTGPELIFFIGTVLIGTPIIHWMLTRKGEP